MVNPEFFPQTVRRMAQTKWLLISGLLLVFLLLLLYRAKVRKVDSKPYMMGREGARCHQCFHWQFPYTISPRANLCDASKIDLVLIIASYHDHAEHRQLLRQVYHAGQWEKHQVRMFFAFGNEAHSNKSKEKELLVENDKYHDILQTAVQGTYQNMTLIIYNALRWVTKSCPNAKFVMKITDDVIVNIPGFLYLLDVKGEEELSDVLVGQCIWGYPAYRKNPKYKMYVPWEAYPYYMYPPFCSGSGFLMSLMTVNELLSEAANIAYPNPHDDVSIGINILLTGHCRCSLKWLTYLVNGPKLMNHTQIMPDGSVNCDRIKTLGYFLGVHLHGISPEGIRKFWLHRKCYEKMIPTEYISSLKCPRRYTCCTPPERVYYLRPSYFIGR